MYVKVKNTGKGFVTLDDRSDFNIIAISLDVWDVEDNAASQAWVTRVDGTIITKEIAEEHINNVNRNIWLQQSEGKQLIDEPETVTL
tara:strand:+ start:682 stop:942 length:261 start_codon:yes stop_codon:yes gene_type:complete